MKYKLHKFQSLAFTSTKPIIVTTSGIQGGKTTVGALYLGNAAFTICKPTDNLLIVAPDYKTLQQATLPKFLEIYGQYGKYLKGEQKFEFFNGVTVFIRTLVKNPNAIEGITNVKRIWLDEGGLISRYAWENVMGRAAFGEAQTIITTTPYALNWLFEMWKDWKKGKRDDVDFISFRSIDNPYFPIKEYERQKALLDPRRFAMKFDGIFGQMEGLVYHDVNFTNVKAMPKGTVYYAGVDWGYNDPFVIVIRALTPQGIHYRIGEFYQSGLTMSDVVEICKSRKQIYNIKMFICDPSRPDSIEELNRNGLTAIGGINNIRAGLDENIRLFRESKFFIVKEDNPMGCDEYNTYHYPERKELKIDDDSKDQLPVDSNNHGCDCDRYVTMYLENAVTNMKTPFVPEASERPRANLARLKWLKSGGSSRNN